MNDVFKALADPTRRRILEMLKERDMSAGEIANAFSIGKPSISHHLSQLKASDLVQADRNGQNIIYSINTSVFQDVVSWIYGLKEQEEEKGKEDKQ